METVIRPIRDDDDPPETCKTKTCHRPPSRFLSYNVERPEGEFEHVDEFRCLPCCQAIRDGFRIQPAQL